MMFEQFAAEHGLNTARRTEPLTGVSVYVDPTTQIAESAFHAGAEAAIANVPRRASEIRVGDVFSELTATAVEGRHSSGKRTRLCRCSCGAEVTVIETRLRAGQVKSCGHLYESRFGMAPDWMQK